MAELFEEVGVVGVVEVDVGMGGVFGHGGDRGCGCGERDSLCTRLLWLYLLPMSGRLHSCCAGHLLE